MKLLNFKKEIKLFEIGILAVFIIFLVLPFRIPDEVSKILNSPVGVLAVFVVIVYLFMYTHPILGILSLFVAYEVFRRTSSEPMSTADTEMPMNEYETQPLSADSVSNSSQHIDNLDGGITVAPELNMDPNGLGGEFNVSNEFVNTQSQYENELYVAPVESKIPPQTREDEFVIESNNEQEEIMKRLNPDMSTPTLEEDIINSRSLELYDLNTTKSVNSKSILNTYSTTTLSMGEA